MQDVFVDLQFLSQIYSCSNQKEHAMKLNRAKIKNKSRG